MGRPVAAVPSLTARARRRARPAGAKALRQWLAWAWLASVWLAVNACAQAQPPPQPPMIDLAHYWISPGERASLDILKAAFTAAGGVWLESRSGNYETMKRDVVRRLAVGVQPSAMWWGTEDRSVPNIDEFLRPVNELAPAGWSDHLNSTARIAVGSADESLHLPITIHNENWAWYNRRVYERHKLPLPATWDEFLQQAPVLAAQGVAPIAVSNQAFSVRILFTTIIAAVAGRDIYRRLYLDADPLVFDDARTRKALEIFLALRRWAPSERGARTWDEATRQVDSGQAAMLVMGDWARGEFSSVGVTADSAIICAPPPGGANRFIAAVDMFAFLRSNRDEAGQRLLADLVLRPDIQVQFANRKGSTPVLEPTADAAAALHECSRSVISLLNSDESRWLSPRSILAERPRIKLQNVLLAHWRNPSTDIDRFTAELKAALR